MPREGRLPEEYDAPPSWSGLLADYDWHPVSAGASEAAVFMLRASGVSPLFAKSGDITSISNEIDRLIWLRETSIGCPRVIAAEKQNGKMWMLMSAVEGEDLFSGRDISPDCAVAVASEAIQLLHSLDKTTCPFDSRLDQLRAEARHRIDEHLVDESDFDSTRKGRSPESILQDLHRMRQDEHPIVVGHGDPGLANILTLDGRLSGVIDCGRLGLADAHHDLAIVSRDITERWGAAWSDRFLERVPHEVDHSKLEYYRLLDELF